MYGTLKSENDENEMRTNTDKTFSNPNSTGASKEQCSSNPILSSFMWGCHAPCAYLHAEGHTASPPLRPPLPLEPGSGRDPPPGPSSSLRRSDPGPGGGPGGSLPRR